MKSKIKLTFELDFEKLNEKSKKVIFSIELSLKNLLK